MNLALRSAPLSPTPGRRARPWLALLVVSLGLFLAVVSTTVVSVALPVMGHRLQASATQLEWIVDAYVVVYASGLVPGGAHGDRRGRKGLFLSGVATFALGSLLTGLAPTVPVVLIGRVVQGLGAALLAPGSLTIIRAVFDDPRQRATAIGLWSTSSGVALAVGPPLGGLLVAGFGWRAVFLAVVPLALLVLALGAWTLPRLPSVPPGTRFDRPAALLSTLGVALLALGVIEGQGHGWTNTWVLAAFVVGVLALSAFVVVERRRVEPLVDVALFTRPAFSVANAAAFVVFFAFVGALVYFSAYFQQVQGRTPTAAGLAVAPVGVAYALAASVSGRLVARAGERWPLIVGLAVAGAATLGLVRLTPTTSLAAIWWDFALLGAGIGLCGTPMSTIAMSAVESARAGQASALVNAGRQIGQVFGVAVLGVLVYAHLPGASGTGTRLDPAAQDAFVLGLHEALWLSGLALLAIGALALLLLPGPRPALATTVSEAVGHQAVATPTAQTPTSVSIRGRVRRPAGTAIAGATVTLANHSGRQVGRVVTTQAGQFMLDAPAGPAYLLITAAAAEWPTATAIGAHQSVELEITLMPHTASQRPAWEVEG